MKECESVRRFDETVIDQMGAQRCSLYEHSSIVMQSFDKMFFILLLLLLVFSAFEFVFSFNIISTLLLSTTINEHIMRISYSENLL